MQYDLIENILKSELSYRQICRYATSALYRDITGVLTLSEKERAELQAATESLSQVPAPASSNRAGGAGQSERVSG
jgi:hypothetical protein